MTKKITIATALAVFAVIAVYAATVNFQTCGGTQTIPHGQLDGAVLSWVSDGCNEFVFRYDQTANVFVGHGYRAEIATPTPEGTPTATPVGHPNVLVSGAGVSAANGLYTFRGTIDLGAGPLPYYNLVGQPDNPFLYSVVWGEGVYLLINHGLGIGDGTYYYSPSTSPFDTPWNALTVEADPAPTVIPSF